MPAVHVINGAGATNGEDSVIQARERLATFLKQDRLFATSWLNKI